MTMVPVKEELHAAIELLTDAEVRHVAHLVRTLQKQRGLSPTLSRLAAAPAFKVAPSGLSHFRPVEPARGNGIPASQLLVEDRR
jgi:hypothetical protein